MIVPEAFLSTCCSPVAGTSTLLSLVNLATLTERPLAPDLLAAKLSPVNETGVDFGTYVKVDVSKKEMVRNARATTTTAPISHHFFLDLPRFGILGMRGGGGGGTGALWRKS